MQSYKNNMENANFWVFFCKKFAYLKKMCYLCIRFWKRARVQKKIDEHRAFSSAGLEHLPYKQRVCGSNP